MAIDALSDNSRVRSAASVMRCNWRSAFVAVFIVLQLIKLALAACLPLFGDEAFYWQESWQLAWGYSDLPGMTAWLIALGRSLGGDNTLAVRSVFVLLGAMLPWLVVWFARRHFGARHGWQAGLLAMGLPLLGSLGVLALPDVMLTVAAMLSLLSLDIALHNNQWRYWLLLGLALLLALSSHYRAAMLLLAGGVFALATARGRELWRNPRWYVALIVAALGVIPALIYNLGHHWAGLAFQLFERNPWTFHADTLRQPLEQALGCTPLMYALLLWAAWYSVRRTRQGAPWDLIASASLTFLLGYFLFGLFADDLRFRLHWPLPGYLPLLAVVPILASAGWHASRRRAFKRGLLVAAWVSLAAGQTACLLYLGSMSLPNSSRSWLRADALSDIFDGWRPATQLAASLLEQPRLAQAIVVADNFRLAAELDFGLENTRSVYSLDSPLNRKHGRARQLLDWQRDEAGLFKNHAGQLLLLAVEETSLSARLRPAWLGSLCSRFQHIQPLERIDIGPHKRIAFYSARLRQTAMQGPFNRNACIIWRQAYGALSSANAGANKATPG